MRRRKLIGNQEELTDRQYLYYPDQRKKAILIHILKDGDCSACWEKKTNHFTDGNKVYKRL